MEKTGAMEPRGEEVRGILYHEVSLDGAKWHPALVEDGGPLYRLRTLVFGLSAV